MNFNFNFVRNKVVKISSMILLSGCTHMCKVLSSGRDFQAEENPLLPIGDEDM